MNLQLFNEAGTILSMKINGNDVAQVATGEVALVDNIPFPSTTIVVELRDATDPQPVWSGTFDAATYMNTQWSVFASAKRGVTSLVFQLMRGESTRVLDDGLNNARLRVRP